MKILRYPLLLIFVLVLSATASAQTLYEQSMSKGLADYEKKDFTAAEEAFRSALKESPDDYKATLYLGLTLNRDGSKEAEGLLKKALRMNPQEPLTNLNLGIYYFNKSVYPEAKDYFETTVELAPNTEYSTRASQYLMKMKEKRAAICGPKDRRADHRSEWRRLAREDKPRTPRRYIRSRRPPRRWTAWPSRRSMIRPTP